MCGIVGIVDFDKVVDKDLLNKMTDTLQHRGPDNGQCYTKSTNYYNIGFGHRRLSIIDLSEDGNQPMHLGDLTIIFNGEFYNYKEVKSELQKLGHQFKSNSDTEVILMAYRQWGEEMIHRLNGMFAFALLDSSKKKLFLFRDRAGIKPLFYFRKGNLWMFASELKPLCLHPAFPKQLDIAASALFFQYGYIPFPQSIYKDTYKLKPGHYLKIDLQNRKFKDVKYWDVTDSYNKPTLKISENEAIEETERILKSCCEYRMVSDVPVGVFLSGGYDSSVVTALLQHNRTQKIKTFTLGFDFEDFNEAGYAKDVSECLGTDHTEFICTEKEAQATIPELTHFYDEPFGDSSAIPTMLISKVARQKVKVALSGEGGDETFAGYDGHFNVLQHYKKLASIPEIFRFPISTIMKMVPPKFIPYLNKKPKFKKHYQGVISILDTGVTIGNVHSIAQQKIFSRDIPNLFDEMVQTPHSYFDNTDYLKGVNNKLNKLLAIDYKTYLVDDLLTKADRATMAHSLEGRVPFLDYRLIEYVAQLPASFKINGKVKKYLLKTITHKYLPKELMERPKQGFRIPLEHWFRTDLKHFFDKYFDEKRIVAQGIFSHSFIKAKLKAYLRGNDTAFHFLWLMLIFQMWHEKWMEA